MRGSQGITSPTTLTCSHTNEGPTTESAMFVKAVQWYIPQKMSISNSIADELKVVLGHACNALVSTLVLDTRNPRLQPGYLYQSKQIMIGASIIQALIFSIGRVSMSIRLYL